MPRKGPPAGYMTATEAGKLLGPNMLYKYVNSGRLKRYRPSTRKQGYYSVNEVMALVNEERAFYEQPAKDIDATFSLAQPEDMEGVDDLAVRLFGKRTIGADRRRSWLTKEPRGNYVMKRKSDNKVVAYFYVQSLTHQIIEDYLHQKIRGWQITEDHIVPFLPGVATECFIGAIGTDPDARDAVRTAYMAMLLRGIRQDLERLGHEGVTISKLYAASSSLEGILMCLHLGMDQWALPKRKRCTFVLDVEQSGGWLFQPYKQALAQWQHEHNTAQPSRRPPIATLQLNALDACFSRPIEEILPQCAAGIVACWHLSKSAEAADLALAFHCVSGYLPTLKAIVKDSSQHRKAAATLAGQSALLQTILGLHLQGFKEAEQYAQEAVAYSKEAQDLPLLLSALHYAAWVYSYAKRDQQALRTIEQALPLLKPKSHTAPLPSHLRGGVYSTLAVMQAKNGQEATTSLGLAKETFFAAPGEELCFVDTVDHRASEIVVLDAAAQYYQGKADRALDVLSQVIDPETLVLKMPLPERVRIETLNDMARAVLKSEHKDIERVIHFWGAALAGALKLHSEQRLNEVLVTYEIMQSLWPREKRITELRDLIVRW